MKQVIISASIMGTMALSLNDSATSVFGLDTFTLEIVSGGALLLALIIILIVVISVKRHKKADNNLNTKLAKNLNDERARSSVIINSIDDAVILFDQNKTIRLFNPAASRISGWSGEDATGLDYHSVLEFADDKGQTYDVKNHPFDKVFADNKTFRDTTGFIVTKSKKQIPANFSVTPLIDENNNLSGAVAVITDVTKERAEMQQRAEFISTASHEMRTPVAAIEGYLELALNEKVATVDERARGFLEKARGSTKHLGELFQDLLTSSKAEDGRLVNHPSAVEMGTFVQQLANDLKFAADKKGLASQFILGANQKVDVVREKVIKPLYYVNADPDRLREVITNIFDNACKYTQKGGIVIGLTGDDQVVQVYIKDTGVGIPEEDLPHLFEKFYRVDNSATRTIGGTGLGLFICRKIIEIYQGRIWADSKIGQGSTFYINLPRISTEQAERLMPQPTPIATNSNVVQ